jgi:glyoxylase-like metal-dependent hydrolase (beta-lactamase superfamily II)
LTRVVLVLCFAVLVLGEAVHTQSSQAQGTSPRARAVEWPPKLTAPAPGEVEVLPVQGNVFLISGAGANITAQAGDQGILLVDTGSASMSAKVIAALKTLPTKAPLRYIVNTTHFLDHVGGNAAVAPTGEIIPFREPNYTAGPQGALDVHKASVISYLTVFHRMAEAEGKAQATPEVGWPDNTYSIEQKRLSFNDEPVVITHMPGSTDGDSIVHFRKSDVISVGELLDLTRYPMIDVQAGGNVQALIKTLNELITLTVPQANAAGGTMVIPAHGRVADHAEVAYYRDMVTIVRDRVQDMVNRKMTLAQVKAARPSRDWDARYGKTTGPWTTDMFVEAVYRSLTKS